jgi:CheY-like chemotaxis protein
MRVMLADDAMLFREGTARILIEAGFEVVGQARDAAELLALLSRDPPAAAIIDIRMPPGHSAEGIEAAAEIRRMFPDVGLLLLSQHVDTHHAMRLMTEFQAGLVGSPAAPADRHPGRDGSAWPGRVAGAAAVPGRVGAARGGSGRAGPAARGCSLRSGWCGTPAREP